MKKILNTMTNILMKLMGISFIIGFILLFALSFYSLCVYGDNAGLDYVIRDIKENGLIFFQ